MPVLTKVWCMCVCVCVSVCTWGQCHRSLIGLNLPKSDRGRWIQLGRRGWGLYGWWWSGGVGKNQTWFQFRQRSGVKTHAQPKSGVSIQSQLVWLYHMQDIYFRSFVGIFTFYLNFSFVFFSFVTFLQIHQVFDWNGPQLVLQGVTSWGSRKTWHGWVYTVYLFSLSLFPLLLL